MIKKPFMFVIKSKPLPDNNNYYSIRSALVHIWVLDISIDDAREKAFSYIKSFHWAPIVVESAFAILPEQLSHLDTRELLLYQKALHYGIAAEFLASPLRDQDPETPPEYRNV